MGQSLKNLSEINYELVNVCLERDKALGVKDVINYIKLEAEAQILRMKLYIAKENLHSRAASLK
jgi:hypothetical protein